MSWPFDYEEPVYPFYAVAEPCESCGKPVFGERFAATWDETVLVGECCRFHLDDILDQPMCPEFDKYVAQCKTTYEVAQAFEAHWSDCRECQMLSLRPVRRPVTSEGSRGTGERQVA
jgi:hypothetical protein